MPGLNLRGPSDRLTKKLDPREWDSRWLVRYRGKRVDLISVSRRRSEELMGDYVELHVFVPDEIDFRAEQAKPLPQIAQELDHVLKVTDA